MTSRDAAHRSPMAPPHRARGMPSRRAPGMVGSAMGQAHPQRWSATHAGRGGCDMVRLIPTRGPTCPACACDDVNFMWGAAGRAMRARGYVMCAVCEACGRLLAGSTVPRAAAPDAGMAPSCHRTLNRTFGPMLEEPGLTCGWRAAPDDPPCAGRTWTGHGAIDVFCNMATCHRCGKRYTLNVGRAVPHPGRRPGRHA